MHIDSQWRREGTLLAMRLKVSGEPTTIYYRIISREFADQYYSFGSIAANTGSGFIDLQNAQNTYILEPRREDIIHHIYLGIYPSSAVYFLNYPAGYSHNSLVQSSTIDGTATGGLRGSQSMMSEPSVKTELFVLRDMRPTLQLWNNDQVNSQTLLVHLYAMMYQVTGPYLLGSPEVGDATAVQSLYDSNNAKLYSIYGSLLADAPDRIVRQLTSLASGVPAPVAASRRVGY